MLKNKLSHLHLLDEQLERLQSSAVEISVVTGHDLEQVEGAIVSLLTPHAADGCAECGSTFVEIGTKARTCALCGSTRRR